MSLHQDVQGIYNRLFAGEVSLEEAAQWAYDALNENPVIEDAVTDDALYKLVSHHPIGRLYEPWLPGEEALSQVRDQLNSGSNPYPSDVVDMDLT